LLPPLSPGISTDISKLTKDGRADEGTLAVPEAYANISHLSATVLVGKRLILKTTDLSEVYPQLYDAGRPDDLNSTTHSRLSETSLFSQHSDRLLDGVLGHLASLQ
jgi:hypothetical protein